MTLNQEEINGHRNKGTNSSESQEGTLATWHKQPGEAVNRDELIVDIETDKVVLEVVAPATVGGGVGAEGDIVLSNEVVSLKSMPSPIQFDGSF